VGRSFIFIYIYSDWWIQHHFIRNTFDDPCL